MAEPDDAPRGPVQGLTDLARSLGGDPSQPQMSTFLRGLVVGAFVGAAVAGSTIWRRRRDQAAKLRAAQSNLERSASRTTTAGAPSPDPEADPVGSEEPEADDAIPTQSNEMRSDGA